MSAWTEGTARVPARDARSLHGSNATLTVFDEFHAQNDYGVVEALAPSPARKQPRTLYLSYAGLRSQMREGNPLWDLWQRWKAGDPQLFVSYIGGADGWKQVPWITERFIDQQRRKFASVPSKFNRLWQNEWAAGDEGSFLTGEEIHAAIDTTLCEPYVGEPGIRYTIGVDLGLTFDWTAIVVSHVAADHRLVVDAVRFWRGTRQAPVSITRVEDELIALADKFPTGHIVLDQWQSNLLAERLRLRLSGRNVHIETVAVEPARLDRMATQLKHVFSSRLIRMPNHPELVEQLETIIGVEQKRRDLVRFTSGSGSDAGKHDDIVIALVLSMEGQAREIGRSALPTGFQECYRAASVASFNPGECFLLGGNYVPGGCPSCAACPGWRYVRQEWKDHNARGGEPLGIRAFKQAYVLDNAFVARWHINRWADVML